MATVRSTRYYENFNTPKETNSNLTYEKDSQSISNNIENLTSHEKENQPQLEQNVKEQTPAQTYQVPIPDEFLSLRKELVYDTSNDDFAPEDSYGKILVQVSTARGTEPIPEATIIIYKQQNGENNIVSFNLTDKDGRTPEIIVPAPAKADSQAPSTSLPFADYNITVRHPMFYTAIIDNVQVFGEELTIQLVELIPLPELVNELDITRTVTIPKQNL